MLLPEGERAAIPLRVRQVSFPCLFGALLISLWSTWAAPSLRAQDSATRVVVEDFRGPRASRFRAQLVANLRDAGVEVVSSGDLRMVARTLGLKLNRLKTADYVAIARRLGADAFVSGRVTRGRRRWALTVSVRNGADGLALGQEGWSGRTQRSLASIRRNGYATLEPYLSAARRPGTGLAGAQSGAGQTPAVPTVADPSPTVSPAPTYAPSPETVPQADGQNPWAPPPVDTEMPWYAQGGEADEEDVTDRAGSEGSHRYLRLGFDVGLMNRQFRAVALVRNKPLILNEAGVDPRLLERRDPVLNDDDIIDETRQYSAAPGHPEIGLRAEFYPFAIADDQPFPFVGVVARYHRSIFLSSQGCGDAACEQVNRINVETTEQEYYVGLRGYVPLFDGALELGLEPGFGALDFSFDEQTLLDVYPSSVLPSTTYSYLHFGLDAYAQVVPWLGLGFSAGYRLGLGVGLNAREMWGVKSSFDGGVQVGGEVRVPMGFLVDGLYASVTTEYSAYTVQFAGQTQEPWEAWPYQGNDPDDVVGGVQDPVSDTYLRAGIRIGLDL